MDVQSQEYILIIFHPDNTVYYRISNEMMKTSNDTHDEVVDWKTLPPLELVQYLVSEAAIDPGNSNNRANRCIEFIMSPTETSTVSWTDSIVSHQSHKQKEPEEEFSFVFDPVKDGKLSGRKRGKKSSIADKALTLSPKLECSKKDFSEVMNNWLRENWTNPYPDDDGLNEISVLTGCTPTVVSNWLINARTRKWRPAIVKASENGRPASLLQEDSINIFDGKPLRSI